jgi:hypothetical protein
MAILSRNRPGILGPLVVGLVCVSALGASSPALAAGTFLDAVLASVAGKTVTVTDVAIGRALSLFGLRPSEAPIGKGEVEQVVNAVLLEREAAQLAIGDAPEEVETAWHAAADRLGGMPALLAWMTQAELDERWVKSLVETDLRGQRFIDLRFRAFAFVSDADVTAALGPGAHAPDVRDRAREVLRTQAIDRAVADWLADARTRNPIGLSDTGARGVSPPFSMPAQGARH